MSLQALYAWVLSHPALSLNGLALFFALAGSWLLIATRVRVQRAGLRLAGLADELEGEAECALDEPTRRLNRFFYGFAFATLALALLLSFCSCNL